LKFDFFPPPQDGATIGSYIYRYMATNQQQQTEIKVTKAT